MQSPSYFFHWNKLQSDTLAEEYKHSSVLNPVQQKFVLFVKIMLFHIKD